MSKLIDDALKFATRAHHGQQRAGGGDYINHPREVAAIVAKVPGATDEMVAAALLHDVVEDCGVSLDELATRFGYPVTKLVDELTKRPIKGNRDFRVARETERLAEVSAEAQTIKYADIISNTRTVVADKPEFAARYKGEKKLALTRMHRGDHLLRQTAWLQVMR